MSTAKQLCLQRIEAFSLPIPDLSRMVFQYIQHKVPEYEFTRETRPNSLIFLSPRRCDKYTPLYSQRRTIRLIRLLDGDIAYCSYVPNPRTYIPRGLGVFKIALYDTSQPHIDRSIHAYPMHPIIPCLDDH